MSNIEISDLIDGILGPDGKAGCGDDDFMWGYLPTGSTYKGEPIKLIEHKGGEGEGEHAHCVVKIGEKYYRCDYSYYSYDGYNYDGCYFKEAKPVQKTITVYE